jgi:hypothetical protein
MGDHICGASQTQQGQPEKEEYLMQIAYEAKPMAPPPRPVLDERMPMPPPAVDTSIANRQYTRSGQYTPVSSSSESRSISPHTPAARSASSQRGDYFAPRIVSDSSRMMPASQAPPVNNYGLYDERDMYENDKAGGGRYGQADSRQPNPYYPESEYPASIDDYAPRQGGNDSAPYWSEPGPDVYRSLISESSYSEYERSRPAQPEPEPEYLQAKNYNGRPSAPRPQYDIQEEPDEIYISRTDTLLGGASSLLYDNQEEPVERYLSRADTFPRAAPSMAAASSLHFYYHTVQDIPATEKTVLGLFGLSYGYNGCW